MPKYKLPSSQNMIAFEAAARLKSFNLAADELCLSPPAITNRIKQIERDLGQKLFVRLPKGIQLTGVGEDFYYEISKSLNNLQKTIDKYKNKIAESVAISVTPTFANRWLAKRLKYFWQAYPEIALKIYHSLDDTPLSSEQINIAVRWGNGHWPGLVAEHLFSGDKCPIISPSLAKKVNLQHPNDLQRVTLLHEDSHDEWNHWFDIIKLQPVNTRLDPIIDDAEVLLALTIDGQGVALGRIAMLEAELNSKQLICPFTTFLPSDNGYWLVYPPSLKDNQAVMCFRDFLLKQIKKAPLN